MEVDQFDGGLLVEAESIFSRHAEQSMLILYEPSHALF